MKTLVDWATCIREPQYLGEVLKHVNTTLQAIGYLAKEVRRALQLRKSGWSSTEDEQETLGTTFLPYIRHVTDRIGKILERHKVKTVFRPMRKIHQYLKSAKDARDLLSSAGVYRVPFSRGQVYIGTTKRNINTRITEHK